MQPAYVLLTTIVSFFVCNLLTHPQSKIWQKLPRLKLKRFDIFPSIRISIKGKIIHFHHWFNFSVLLVVSVFVSDGILDNWTARSILLGGVIQGLATPSARKIIYSKDTLE